LTSDPAHPNARLVEAFYVAQRRFYAGEDNADELRGFLAEDIAWHVPGRSPIAGDYRGMDQVLAYFADRRARAKATFRIQPHGMLADDERVVHFARGHAERAGKTWEWETVGVFRLAGGRIAECWLLPFDQYAFDEIWA
jgi:ketosteroid isomerase-like protein